MFPILFSFLPYKHVENVNQNLTDMRYGASLFLTLLDDEKTCFSCSIPRC
jgi:hypothetical protein